MLSKNFYFGCHGMYLLRPLLESSSSSSGRGGVVLRERDMVLFDE